MTKLTMRTLILAAMPATPACAANVDAPADPLSQQPAAAEETHSTVSPAPKPPDYADALDIIEKVDAFYQNAWLKLMALVAIGGALVGVVMPIILERRQSKSFDRTKKELDDEIARVHAALKNDIEQVTEQRNEAETRMLAKVADEFNNAQKASGEFAEHVGQEILLQGFNTAHTLFRLSLSNPEHARLAIHLGAVTVEHCYLLSSLPPLDLRKQLFTEIIEHCSMMQAKQCLREDVNCRDEVRSMIAMLKEGETSEEVLEFAAPLQAVFDQATGSQ